MSKSITQDMAYRQCLKKYGINETVPFRKPVFSQPV